MSPKNEKYVIIDYPEKIKHRLGYWWFWRWYARLLKDYPNTTVFILADAVKLAPMNEDAESKHQL
jgi:hypothetical protein